MGFEPTTHSLEGCCSIQLSYGHTTYIKCFLVQVKSSTSCEYDVYLATPCHCSCVSRAAKIGCKKSIYFRKYYIETYLTNSASALIIALRVFLTQNLFLIRAGSTTKSSKKTQVFISGLYKIIAAACLLNFFYIQPNRA